MSSRCEIRIRTSSFINFPQPPLDSSIIIALQNGDLSEEEIKYIKESLAKNKRASAQFEFYHKLSRHDILRP